MKMTMHIDEDTLAEVIKITGVPSKTKAVEVALKEMVRKHKFKAIASRGLEMTPQELKNAWEDPFPEEKSLRIAEEPPPYDREHPGR